MKKISTVGDKQKLRFSKEHKLTIGLDLGDRPATTAFWMKRAK